MVTSAEFRAAQSRMRSRRVQQAGTEARSTERRISDRQNTARGVNREELAIAQSRMEQRRQEEIDATVANFQGAYAQSQIQAGADPNSPKVRRAIARNIAGQTGKNAEEVAASLGTTAKEWRNLSPQSRERLAEQRLSERALTYNTQTQQIEQEQAVIAEGPRVTTQQNAPVVMGREIQQRETFKTATGVYNPRQQQEQKPQTWLQRKSEDWFYSSEERRANLNRLERNAESFSIPSLTENAPKWVRYTSIDPGGFIASGIRRRQSTAGAFERGTGAFIVSGIETARNPIGGTFVFGAKTAQFGEQQAQRAVFSVANPQQVQKAFAGSGGRFVAKVTEPEFIGSSLFVASTGALVVAGPVSAARANVYGGKVTGISLEGQPVTTVVTGESIAPASLAKIAQPRAIITQKPQFLANPIKYVMGQRVTTIVQPGTGSGFTISRSLGSKTVVEQFVSPTRTGTRTIWEGGYITSEARISPYGAKPLTIGEPTISQSGYTMNINSNFRAQNTLQAGRTTTQAVYPVSITLKRGALYDRVATGTYTTTIKATSRAEILGRAPTYTLVDGAWIETGEFAQFGRASGINERTISRSSQQMYQTNPLVYAQTRFKTFGSSDIAIRSVPRQYQLPRLPRIEITPQRGGRLYSLASPIDVLRSAPQINIRSIPRGLSKGAYGATDVSLYGARGLDLYGARSLSRLGGLASLRTGTVANNRAYSAYNAINNIDSRTLNVNIPRSITANNVWSLLGGATTTGSRTRSRTQIETPAPPYPPSINAFAFPDIPTPKKPKFSLLPPFPPLFGGGFGGIGGIGSGRVSRSFRRLPTIGGLFGLKAINLNTRDVTGLLSRR